MDNISKSLQLLFFVKIYLLVEKNSFLIQRVPMLHYEELTAVKILHIYTQQILKEYINTCIKKNVARLSTEIWMNNFKEIVTWKN